MFVIFRVLVFGFVLLEFQSLEFSVKMNPSMHLIPEETGNPNARNLVFTNSGVDHRGVLSWVYGTETPSWDLVLAYYGEEPPTSRIVRAFGGEVYSCHGSLKFEAFLSWAVKTFSCGNITELGRLLTNTYKAIWLPDADVYVADGVSSINELFETADTYQLYVASPAHETSRYWQVMEKQNFQSFELNGAEENLPEHCFHEVRRVTYVEVGALLLRDQAMHNLLAIVYDRVGLKGGLPDIFYGIELELGLSILFKNMGVVDSVSIYHDNNAESTIKTLNLDMGYQWREVQQQKGNEYLVKNVSTFLPYPQSIEACFRCFKGGQKRYAGCRRISRRSISKCLNYFDEENTFVGMDATLVSHYPHFFAEKEHGSQANNHTYFYCAGQFEQAKTLFGENVYLWKELSKDFSIGATNILLASPDCKVDNFPGLRAKYFSNNAGDEVGLVLFDRKNNLLRRIRMNAGAGSTDFSELSCLKYMQQDFLETILSFSDCFALNQEVPKNGRVLMKSAEKESQCATSNPSLKEAMLKKCAQKLSQFWNFEEYGYFPGAHYVYNELSGACLTYNAHEKNVGLEICSKSNKAQVWMTRKSVTINRRNSFLIYPLGSYHSCLTVHIFESRLLINTCERDNLSQAWILSSIGNV
jgi:hypothetical protein